MSVNLEIDFNNNYITNSSYTKFLGVTVDNIFLIFMDPYIVV